MFFEKFANLFTIGTDQERKEQHNDEKTDIPAAVGGTARRDAGLRGIGQDEHHRPGGRPERPHHHGSGESAGHGTERQASRTSSMLYLFAIGISSRRFTSLGA